MKSQTSFEPGYAAKAKSTPWNLRATTRYDFAVGHPDRDHFPTTELAEATARMLQRAGGRLALYPEGAIHEPTRELVARKYLVEEGLRVPTDEILVTSGSLQGLTMIAESFIDPGQTVVIEEFTYQGTLRAFNSCQPKYATVPVDDEGIVVSDLERTLDDLRRAGVTPRFIYVITHFQNPTGVVMSETRRRALIDLATERSLLIIEDDVYSDLIYEGEFVPSLYSMRRIDNVIRIGTFSKIVGAGVRLGWLVGPPPILSHMSSTKIDGGTSSFVSLAVAEYLGDRLESRVAEMRAIYRAKRDAMYDALQEHFADFAEWSRPRGGLFLWVRMPEGFDSAARLPEARAADVDYLPGPNFSPTRAGANYIRLSFGYLNTTEIREGLAVLADVIAP